MDDSVVLLCVPRPVDVRAAGDGVLLALLQVVGQPRKRVLLDLMSQRAELLPFGDGAGDAVALGSDEPYRLVVPVKSRIVGNESSSFARMLVYPCGDRRGRRAVLVRAPRRSRRHGCGV